MGEKLKKKYSFEKKTSLEKKIMNIDGKSSVEILNKTNLSLRFVITNVDYMFLNMLRGVLLEEIPCLAFHSFRFDVNDTIMQHEKIMNLMRMLPMDSSECAKLQWTADCDCNNELCVKCSIEFCLDVENNTDELLHVTTDDLKLNSQHLFSKPLFKMTIVTLAPGDRLKMTAHLQKGIGRDHGKWVCVPTVGIQGVPLLDATTFHILTNDEQHDIVAKCPKNVFRMKHMVLDIEDLYACTACDECLIQANACIKTHKKRKQIQDIEPYITLSDNKFIVTIDSDGRFDIDVILQHAFAIIQSKLNIMFLYFFFGGKGYLLVFVYSLIVF